MPRMKRDAEEMKVVKWFGDKGAHDSRMPIFAKDIQDNIAPKVRSFVSNLDLKIQKRVRKPRKSLRTNDL